MASQISNNLITLVSANSLNGLRTGNIVLDICIALLLVLLIPHIAGFWSKIPFKGWFSRKEQCNMKFIGTERQLKTTSTIREYSNNFCAIMKYIEKSGKAKTLEEYFKNNSYDGIVVQFRPQSSNPIKLTSTISCEISTTKGESQSTTELILHSNAGLEDIKTFLKCVICEYNNYMDERLSAQQYYFCPLTSNGGGACAWRYFAFSTNKNLSNVFFPEKAELLSEINYFLNGKQIYEERGVPWQLGILLHGKPGTGKTSFIKALAKYTGRHIIEVPLSRIKTYELLRSVMLGDLIGGFRMPHHKRLYLMEDVDCLDDIIHSRENVKKSKESSSELDEKFEHGDNLRLSHILNIIDGILEAPGRMLIITTNYIEKLDEALIRDGRMDIKLEMKPIQGDCLRDMVLSFYPTKTLEDLEPFLPLKNKEDLTPATIQGLCFRKDFEEVCDVLQ